MSSIKTFLNGQCILRTGEESNAMFIIVSGKISIISEETGKVFDILHEGQFFGEVGFLKELPRSATARVDSEFSSVIAITKKAIQKVLDDYPDAYVAIELEAERRYRNILDRQTSSTSSSDDQKVPFFRRRSPSSSTVPPAGPLMPRRRSSIGDVLQRMKNLSGWSTGDAISAPIEEDTGSVMRRHEPVNDSNNENVC